MRVLQIITDTDRRGAQVFATDLEPALAALDHDVRTVALAPGSNSSGNLDVEVLGSSRIRRNTITALQRLAKGTDVIAAHGSSTLAACVLAGLGRGGRPFVYRQISDSVFWANTVPRRLRVGVGLRRANRIVALSDGARATLIRHVKAPSGLIDVVPNGVPAAGFEPATPEQRRAARRLLGIDPDTTTVLFIGALVPEKGAEAAITAVAGTGARLLVVGDGPNRNELERLAADLLGDRVQFTGSLADPRPAYRASDLVVLPSRGGDSMPATLIESGFSGLATVTTPVGSIADVVEHDVTGFVTAVGDDDAFAQSVHDLVTNPSLRTKMGERARTRCLEQFEIGVVARGWESTLLRATRTDRTRR